MKKTLAALIALVSLSALAITTPPPPTEPTPAPSTSLAVTSSANSTSASSSTSTGTGTGTADSTSTASGGGASVSSEGDRSRFLSLMLPPLAATPPMAVIHGCAPEVTQSARGILLGVYSEAYAKTDPQDCTLMTLRNAKVEQCQYASAKQIEDLMLVKKLPDFKPGKAEGFVDYDTKACAAMKMPPVAPKPEPVNYIAPPPVAPAAAAVVPVAQTCPPAPAVVTPLAPPSKAKPKKSTTVAANDTCGKKS